MVVPLQRAAAAVILTDFATVSAVLVGDSEGEEAPVFLIGGTTESPPPSWPQGG